MSWLTTGGSTARLFASIDWARTPLGPLEGWSTSLRGYVRMILELPTPAIIFWGPEQTQLYNEGYAAIMGPRHPRYLGAPYRECWPDTHPVIYPWMRRVLEQGEVIQVERAHFHLTRHGLDEEAYFTFTFSPLRDDDGAIAGIYQPVLEVTSATLAERRAATLRTLAVGDGGGWRLEHALRVLASDDKDLPYVALYLLGERGELELAGRAGLDAADAARLAPLSTLADRALVGGGEVEATDPLEGHAAGPWPNPPRAAIALAIRDGPAAPARGAMVFGLSSRLRFDEPYREFLHAITREVATGLSAAEARRTQVLLLAREQAARREAELQKEHLRALLSQAPLPILILRGPSFAVELANDFACRLWRRTAGELLGRPVLEALPELRGQVFAQHLDLVLRTGETVVGRETRAALGDAAESALDELYLDLVLAPLRGVAGQVDGVLAFGVDVTHQVRARQQVDDLRFAAEAANRAKDEFLAVLGHELRNPLAPILTALHLLRSRGGVEVERERRVIERHAEHLVRLVDDLLDVSRITRGKVDLAREPISLADAIARAVEMASPLLESRRQDLRLELAPRDDLVVLGDPVRLAQAVSNLLTNAAKYTGEGGRITVSAARRGDRVELSVRDTGVGISPEMLPRVFDLFTQERQTLERSAGGLGLGLTIVRNLVTLHGGTVEARSEGRGQGSEFIVRLPAAVAGEAEEAPAQGAAPTTPGPPGPAGRAVLVVDDNADAADMLAEVLGELGHTTRVAYDGPEALEAAPGFAPDIALLDIGLPGMDGYELAGRLRARLPGRPLTLVAITGYGQAQDRDRSRTAGFDAHFVKPIDVAELKALIASLDGAPSEGASPRDGGRISPA